MNRRKFLKGLAVIIATPAITQIDQFTKYVSIAQVKAIEHVGVFNLGHGIKVKELGIRERNGYSMLRYQLHKRCKDGNVLEAYSDIDVDLLGVVPENRKYDFIRTELSGVCDAILMEERNKYGCCVEVV
jgi:hypothetical protein